MQKAPDQMLYRVNQSEMRAFMRCPRKWALEYVFGYREKGEKIGALSVGTAVHKALEEYYKLLGEGEPIDAARDGIERLRDEAHVRMELGSETGVASDHPAFASVTADYDFAQLIVEGYFEWLEETGVDAGLKVVATEQTISMPLLPGVELFGTIDLIVEQHGRRIFMDHKTAQSLDIIGRMLPQNFQLLTYRTLLENQSVGVDGVQYNVLKKSKRTARATPPFYVREDVNINRQQIKAHLGHMQEIALHMLDTQKALEARGLDTATKLLYPVVDDDCTWKCSFQKVCPMLDDGSDWQGALDYIYTTEAKWN